MAGTGRWWFTILFTMIISCVFADGVQPDGLGTEDNPFNPETTISFSVRPNDQATLAIYNLKGQRVKSCGKFQTGEHKIIWDGTNDALKPVASGVYLCRLKSNTETMTRKLMLLQ